MISYQSTRDNAIISVKLLMTLLQEWVNKKFECPPFSFMVTLAVVVMVTSTVRLHPIETC